jgi:hypothetical protein
MPADASQRSQNIHNGIKNVSFFVIDNVTVSVTDPGSSLPQYPPRLASTFGLCSTYNPQLQTFISQFTIA